MEARGNGSEMVLMRGKKAGSNDGLGKRDPFAVDEVEKKALSAIALTQGHSHKILCKTKSLGFKDFGCG
jgi:hypothetical protein